MEQKVSVSIRNWLKLHRSTTSLCLYSSISPCPLPIKSLTYILKSAKISGHLLLRESSDPLVSGQVPGLKAGCWKVADIVRQSEAQLEIQEIQGQHPINRAGFRSVPLKPIPEKNTAEYRRLIADTANNIAEEDHLPQASLLSLQGNWLKWCDYVKNDFSWKCLFSWPRPLISFCIGATYETLPCPSNLKRWRISELDTCSLCNHSPCYTPHILSGCKVAFNQGRYTFGHDSVLSVIHTSISTFLTTIEPSNQSNTEPNNKPLSFNFVKEGSQRAKRKLKPETGILHRANDWIVLVDTDSTLVFPAFIAITTSRPDIVISDFKQ